MRRRLRFSSSGEKCVLCCAPLLTPLPSALQQSSGLPSALLHLAVPTALFLLAPPSSLLHAAVPTAILLLAPPPLSPPRSGLQPLSSFYRPPPLSSSQRSQPLSSFCGPLLSPPYSGPNRYPLSSDPPPLNPPRSGLLCGGPLLSPPRSGPNRYPLSSGPLLSSNQRSQPLSSNSQP